MIDITVARKVFDISDITNTGWPRYRNNIADGLTKVTTCKKLEASLCNESVAHQI